MTHFLYKTRRMFLGCTLLSISYSHDSGIDHREERVLAPLPSLDASLSRGERPQQWFMEAIWWCRSTTCAWYLLLYLASHYLICHGVTHCNTILHKPTSKGCWVNRVPPPPVLWWTQIGAIIPVTPAHWSPQDCLTVGIGPCILVVKVDTLKSYQTDDSATQQEKCACWLYKKGFCFSRGFQAIS